MLTKGAIGNLLNRYKAVLKKCNLINTFGSLAVASMLVLGGAGVAWGVEYPKTDKRLSSNPNTVSELWWDGLSYDSGGAGSISSGSIIVKDGLFSNNTAKKGGGAIYFSGGVGSFTNVTFENNRSLKDEGGAIKIGRGDYVSLTITNAKFINNNATGQGGAISVERLKEATLTDTTFTGNKARGGWGGGAICNMGGTFTFIGTNEFKNNTTIQVGGAIRNQGGTLNFNGLNTFSGNRSKVTFDDNGDPVQNTGTPNDIYNSGTINVKPNATLSLDGGITGSGKLNFESGSTLLVEDASKLVEGVRSKALIDGGTLTIDSGAKLKLNKAASGVKYRIANNCTNITLDGWDRDDIILTNLLLEAEAIKDNNGKGLIVEVSGTAGGDIAAALPGVIPVKALDEVIKSGISADSEFMGRRFLSRAQDTDYLPGGIGGEAAMRATASKLINEVSRAAVTAGVQNTALRISDTASNTVLDHMSLAQHDGSKAIHSGGVDFWAAPMYGNLYTSGMVTSGSSVRGQFGGLALGADLEAGQFLGGKFRLGAAINGGGGQSETKGDITSTQNDYDFGGLNFYAGWNRGAFNLIASVGYAFGNHEVEMGLPSSMAMDTAKADIDTTAFTADLRAEYQLKTPYVDILPHAGIRYTALKTDAHDLKANGAVLNSVQSDTQNIVQFPVGVTLSKDFALAGWNVKPSADVSVIPAAGEKKATTKVNFSGLDAWDSVNTRVMDSTSWAGTVGIQAEKGNMTFGLNYGVQASSHETDQNIQIKFGWKF